MAQSFLANWPSSIPLTMYAEDFWPDIDGVEVLELPEWLNTFKSQNAARNGVRPQWYDYRFDAIKFSHKVAALTDFALELTDDILIWIDADVITHSPMSEEWLKSLFPNYAYLAWLDRANAHPECGFMMFRCSHSYHRQFMEALRNLYTTGELFKLREHHDSFALQHLVGAKVAKGKIPPPASLSGDGKRTSHPAINGPLGAIIDHCKGPQRKENGRSSRRDLIRQRSEPYWQPP
jgi:hypothetical protein